MNRTEQYFIEALKCFLLGEKIESDTADVQWQALGKLSKIHAVAGILGHTLAEAEGVPAEAIEAFRKKSFSTVMVSSAHISLGEKLMALLEGNGISCIPFKGAVIRRFYPVPELRTFSDIDILVDEDKFDTAHSLLLENGFSQTDGQVGVRGYKKDGFHFEIHNTLAGDMEDLSKKEKLFFDSASQHIITEDSTARLENEYHFAYCLWHLTKHLSSCGAGVRMFMDIAALAKAQSYDWAKVSQYLETLGIKKAAASIFFLCNRWFGTDVPSPFALTLDTETVDAMEQYILTAGTFGFNARSSGSSRLRNSVSEEGSAAKAKRSIIFKMFFPNADYLAKQYPWYGGRKIFLPFMWIYRFFHLLFSRRKGSFKALGDVVHGGEEELREAKLLNRLGWNIYSQK